MEKMIVKSRPLYRNINLIFITLLCVGSNACNSSRISKSNTTTITNACIPNELAALKAAENVWLPIYGNSIYNEKPFKISCIGDSIWVVTGTGRGSFIEVNALGDTIYHLTSGGVAYVELRKSDCAVLKITHGK